MKNYIKQTSPFRVPTSDGKHIEEHFGLAAGGDGAISIARMVAPPGWSEPFQQPEFEEYTLMVRGRKQVEIDGETLVLHAGESLLVRRGARVRYANPFDAEAEYWSVCRPAFSPDTVHREEPS
ncbi:MAG: cupin domain-containing protein [Calditrichaeota bacterium]|nr:cupin domain-containing protein [Calditrichota bacterium]MCB0294776.1 cupin domain-containing protein [Calditrichota bacterium]MCB0306487.1 cupin domain-containing protein [Calditrichota bacterium]MCB0313603.1 cupin domain-containing protein [Calditrichota bacterium]MCB9090794.1 cupin domain-containing protein [Calditrichia bacterium]